MTDVLVGRGPCTGSRREGSRRPGVSMRDRRRQPKASEGSGFVRASGGLGVDVVLAILPDGAAFPIAAQRADKGSGSVEVAPRPVGDQVTEDPGAGFRDATTVQVGRRGVRSLHRGWRSP